MTNGVIAYLSILMTVMSLLFAFQSQALFLSNKCFKKLSGDSTSIFREASFYCKFTIESNKLNRIHLFANEQIGKCVLNALKESNINGYHAISPSSDGDAIELELGEDNSSKKQEVE